jgi:hypothetical protein
MLLAKHLNYLQYITQNMKKQHTIFFCFIQISISITIGINIVSCVHNFHFSNI